MSAWKMVLVLGGDGPHHFIGRRRISGRRCLWYGCGRRRLGVCAGVCAGLCAGVDAVVGAGVGVGAGNIRGRHLMIRFSRTLVVKDRTSQLPAGPSHFDGPAHFRSTDQRSHQSSPSDLPKNILWIFVDADEYHCPKEKVLLWWNGETILERNSIGGKLDGIQSTAALLSPGALILQHPRLVRRSILAVPDGIFPLACNWLAHLHKTP